MIAGVSSDYYKVGIGNTYVALPDTVSLYTFLPIYILFNNIRPGGAHSRYV